MEIKCIERALPVWLDSVQEKCCSLTLESVVPDSQGDAAELLWTQAGLLLKGKELNPGGVTVMGEAWAVVLYRCEEGGLESLRLTKPFRQDFETGELDPAALPQVHLCLEQTEARALNPRKLSVSLRVRILLRSFRPGSLCLESAVPERPAGLHLREENRDVLALTGVWAKPFSLREQLPFPAGSPCPSSLLGHSLRFERTELEQLGSRSVLKGELCLELWGLEETGAPCRCSFNLPFSQLLETGETETACWQLLIEPSTVYLEKTGEAGGEPALDAEVHAVAQLRLWSRQAVRNLTDAYSVSVPCEPARESCILPTGFLRGSVPLKAEESLPLPEDCDSLLAVLPDFGAVRREEESLRLELRLELLYRNSSGATAAVRRRVKLVGRAPSEEAELTDLRLSRPELRREGDSLQLQATAEQDWELREKTTLSRVTAISLDEEKPFDPNAPAVFLVRSAGEDFWELGKRFRADPAAIEAANPQGCDLLLIPREM